MPPPPAETVASRFFLGPALRTQADRRLVTLVREGYEAAFEEIVRRYGKPLGRYAAAIVGGRSEDVTQDVMDGEENAGTIASFDPATGKLVITLFGGETVSGLVTDRTRIDCGHECRNDGDSEASTSSSGPSDNSGPGSGSDQGRDPGQDPPGHDGTPPGASEGPGRGADNSANCTTEALVIGATVEEAELELEHGVATFEKVALDR